MTMASVRARHLASLSNNPVCCLLRLWATCPEVSTHVTHHEANSHYGEMIYSNRDYTNIRDL